MYEQVLCLLFCFMRIWLHIRLQRPFEYRPCNSFRIRVSLYDMLFSENLSKQDIQKIKQVAVDLLQRVKAKIAELDHWTDKQETKAAIDNLIRDTLWSELPACYDELSISGYRQRIYEYVYTCYKDVA